MIQKNTICSVTTLFAISVFSSLNAQAQNPKQEIAPSKSFIFSYGSHSTHPAIYNPDTGKKEQDSYYGYDGEDQSFTSDSMKDPVYVQFDSASENTVDLVQSWGGKDLYFKIHFRTHTDAANVMQDLTQNPTPVQFRFYTYTHANTPDLNIAQIKRGNGAFIDMNVSSFEGALAIFPDHTPESDAKRSDHPSRRLAPNKEILSVQAEYYPEGPARQYDVKTGALISDKANYSERKYCYGTTDCHIEGFETIHQDLPLIVTYHTESTLDIGYDSQKSGYLVRIELETHTRAAALKNILVHSPERVQIRKYLQYNMKHTENGGATGTRDSAPKYQIKIGNDKDFRDLNDYLDSLEEKLPVHYRYRP